MRQWKCGVCGYIHKGAEPPAKCPVCGADKTRFTLVGESASNLDGPPKQAEPPGSAPAPSPATQTIKKWQCTVCGYIYTGAEPPAKCPVCGADKSKFILLDETPGTQTSASQPQNSEAPDINVVPDDSSKEAISFAAPNKKEAIKEELLRTLTRLHAHPIAVHIPNGVLPLTVLFTILALLFQSAGFAMAAKYNSIFVCLAMPLVIVTGLIDWRNRFEQRMSQVFAIKMGCAGVTTVLSITIALWWVLQPDLFLAGMTGNGFFIVLNLFNLTAAAVAGWYGGKLVFPDN